MRSAVRRLLLLGAVAAASLLGATPASAEIASCPSCVGDSPTSVLISNPATDSAARLPITDDDHDALAEALEPGEPAPRFQRGSEPIYITWLARRGAIWDIDLVRLGPNGGIFVRPELRQVDMHHLKAETLVRPDTPPDDHGAGLGRGDGTWHTAADPEAAQDVLERAGVLSTDSTQAPAAADANADGAAPGGTGSQDGSAGALTGWWWLLPGAAVGIALGLGARPAAAELARRREAGPRHQLIG